MIRNESKEEGRVSIPLGPGRAGEKPALFSSVMRVTHRSHKREGTKESRGEQESKKSHVASKKESPTQAYLAVPSGQVEASAGAAAGAGRGDKAPRLAARLPLPDVSGVCLHRRDGRGRVRVLVQARRVWARGYSFCEISSERTVFM